MERLRLLILIILATLLQGCVSARYIAPDGSEFRVSSFLRGPAAAKWTRPDGSSLDYNGTGSALTPEERAAIARALSKL